MLHKETITPILFEVLKALMSIRHLDSFRLVGGTAIALQLGHRKSIDIDLFSNETVNKQILVRELGNKFPEIEFFVSDDSIVTRIHGIKIDIYDQWMIPFKEPPIYEEGIRIASLKDLAAFKLTAFTERRDKKDYIDLFFLFEKFGGLSLLKDYKMYNPLLSPKSLMFALTEVSTAEQNSSPMPDMLLEAPWSKINDTLLLAAKEYIDFLQENRALGNKKTNPR